VYINAEVRSTRECKCPSGTTAKDSLSTFLVIASRDSREFGHYGAKLTNNAEIRNRVLDHARRVFGDIFLPSLVEDSVKKPYDSELDQNMVSAYADEYEARATTKVQTTVVNVCKRYAKEQLRESAYPNKFLVNGARQIFQAMLDGIPISSLNADYLMLGRKVEGTDLAEAEGKDSAEANNLEEQILLDPIGGDAEDDADEYDDSDEDEEEEEDPDTARKRLADQLSDENVKQAQDVLKKLKDCWKGKGDDSISLGLIKKLIRAVRLNALPLLASMQLKLKFPSPKTLPTPPLFAHQHWARDKHHNFPSDSDTELAFNKERTKDKKVGSEWTANTYSLLINHFAKLQKYVDKFEEDWTLYAEAYNLAVSAKTWTHPKYSVSPSTEYSETLEGHTVERSWIPY
jgi:hypothetical protein